MDGNEWKRRSATTLVLKYCAEHSFTTQESNTKQKYNTSTEEQGKGYSGKLPAPIPVTLAPSFTDVSRQNISSPFAVQLMGVDGMCL